MVHDLDLAAHVLDILVSDEFPLGNRLAGELLAGGFLNTEVGGAELTLTKLAAKAVNVLELLCLPLEDRVSLEASAGDALHGRGLGFGGRGGGGGLVRVGDGDGSGGFVGRGG